MAGKECEDYSDTSQRSNEPKENSLPQKETTEDSSNPDEMGLVNNMQRMRLDNNNGEREIVSDGRRREAGQIDADHNNRPVENTTGNAQTKKFVKYQEQRTDPVHKGTDPYGHHTNLKSLKTSMTLKFVMILQNLIKAYHRKSGGLSRQSFDDEVCEKKVTKIGQVNTETFDKACRLLDLGLPGRDWRSLGGRLGYTVDEINMFELEKYKARSMLCHWSTEGDHYLENLVEILRKMKRDDVADLFQKETDEKEDSCTRPDCEHIR